MAKRITSLVSLTVVLLMGVASSQMPAPRMPLPVHVYNDPATGLSFRYPIVWKQVREPSGIFGSSVFVAPGVVASGVPIRSAVEFRAEGNSYAKTTFESTSFLYGVLQHATTATCRKVVTSVDASPVLRTINGVEYTYGKGGDAGMSQTLYSQIFTTLQGSTCYVFEEDFNQTNGIVRDGQRQLTKAEAKSLQDSLDNIMTTVHFARLTSVL